MRKYILSLMLALSLAVGGCTSVRTDNPTDYIAVSVASIEAMANTAGQLQKEGAITEAQEDEYLNQLQSLLSSVELARAAVGRGDDKTALELMREVNKALFILQKQLEEQEGGQ